MFEPAVVVFEAPADLGQPDQDGQFGGAGQGRQPVVTWLAASAGHSRAACTRRRVGPSESCGWRGTPGWRGTGSTSGHAGCCGFRRVPARHDTTRRVCASAAVSEVARAWTRTRASKYPGTPRTAPAGVAQDSERRVTAVHTVKPCRYKPLLARRSFRDSDANTSPTKASSRAQPPRLQQQARGKANRRESKSRDLTK